MLTSEQIEHEVVAYIENRSLRDEPSTKSGLLQSLAEAGTPKPQILAALDRLLDSGDVALDLNGSRLTLQRRRS